MDMARIVNLVQAFDLPLQAVPSNQASMELSDIAGATDCHWGGPHYDVPQCERMELVCMDFLLAHR